MTPEDVAALQGRIEFWTTHPIEFVYEVFGAGYEAETGKELKLDRWHVRAFKALVGECGCCPQPKRRVVARAAKGVGKTAWLAWVGWWFLLTRRRAKGAALSITGDNLSDNLWPELALWQSYSPLLTAFFEHKGEAIEARGLAEDGKTPLGKFWFLSKRAFAKDADTTQQADTLAGLHADAVFLLLDEIGSYPPGVFAAAKAIFNVKGVDALIAAAGNCTDVDGPLYKICTEDADEWHIEEITGDPDDPNCSERVDKDEARRQIKKHSRHDPVIMVNWLGKFPPKAGNKLLGLDQVALAQRRDPHRRLWAQEPIVWGLDVAAGGLARSVLTRRQGCVAFRQDVWGSQVIDDALADQVALRYHEAREKKQAPKKLFVDKGGVGRGVWTRLSVLLGDRIVVGVDFGSMALDHLQYADRRTEMWCRMAEWVREVGSIPAEPELRIDLTGPAIGVSKTVHQGTRRKLEDKESMQKRGLKSPDDGDSLALTFAADVLSDEIDGSRQAFAQTDFDPIEHLSGRG